MWEILRYTQAPPPPTTLRINSGYARRDDPDVLCGEICVRAAGGRACRSVFEISIQAHLSHLSIKQNIAYST